MDTTTTLTEKRKAVHDVNFDDERRRNVHDDASTLHDGFSNTSYPLDLHDDPNETDEKVIMAKEQARYEYKRNLNKDTKGETQPPTDARELAQATDRRAAQRQRRAAQAAANQAQAHTTTQEAQP